MSSTHLQKITTKAKTLRKSHPNKAWTDLVKMAAKLVKPSATKKKKAVSGVKKQAAKAAPAKVKIKVRKTKNGNTTMSIAGVSLSKVKHEHEHQSSLLKAMARHQEALKVKGTTPAEKARIRKEIAHYRNAVSASKKHVSALKRSL